MRFVIIFQFKYFAWSKSIKSVDAHGFTRTINLNKHKFTV